MQIQRLLITDPSIADPFWEDPVQTKIPLELALHIFSFLKFDELKGARLVSRFWNIYLSGNSARWKPRCLQWMPELSREIHRAVDHRRFFWTHTLVRRGVAEGKYRFNPFDSLPRHTLHSNLLYFIHRRDSTRRHPVKFLETGLHTLTFDAKSKMLTIGLTDHSRLQTKIDLTDKNSEYMGKAWRQDHHLAFLLHASSRITYFGYCDFNTEKMIFSKGFRDRHKDYPKSCIVFENFLVAGFSDLSIDVFEITENALEFRRTLSERTKSKDDYDLAEIYASDGIIYASYKNIFDERNDFVSSWDFSNNSAVKELTYLIKGYRKLPNHDFQVVLDTHLKALPKGLQSKVDETIRDMAMHENWGQLLFDRRTFYQAFHLIKAKALKRCLEDIEDAPTKKQRLPPNIVSLINNDPRTISDNEPGEIHDE